MAGTQKYFIAFIPTEPLFSEIESLKKHISETYSTKASLRSPAHITLHMPFEWKEEKENQLIQNLTEFNFGPVFEIELKAFGCFEPKVLFIKIIENQLLNELRQNLVNHMKHRLHIFNESDNLRPFHPHITLAFRDLRKAEFHRAWADFKEKKFSGGFTASRFALLKHDGKRWNVLKEF